MNKKIIAIIAAILIFPLSVNAAWTYNQNFNTLNNGDLNTQDSWSGDTAYDVQTTVKYEGAKGVQVNITGVDQNLTISRTVDAISDGTMYTAIGSDTITGNIMGVYLRSGTTNIIRILLIDGAIKGKNNTAWTSLYASPQVNTWYILKIEFDDATQNDKYRVSVYDGSWQAASAWLTTEAAYTTIDNVQLVAIADSDTSTQNFFDTIQNTDPTATPPPVIVPSRRRIIIF